MGALGFIFAFFKGKKYNLPRGGQNFHPMDYNETQNIYKI